MTIRIFGAREHNLKNIDVEIPRHQLVVITGLSGSGKSSLAFDTLYAEGQRRYVESLSAYARQFLDQMPKPDVDRIEGLSPSISIDQKSASRNPRSTVGTVTEIYDYLRVLYARAGEPVCPECGQGIEPMTVQQMVDQVMGFGDSARVRILSPVVQHRKGAQQKLFEKLRQSGFVRVIVDGEEKLIEEVPDLEKNKNHTIDVVVDRLQIRKGIESRLTDSLETALSFGDGNAKVEWVEQAETYLFSERFGCPACGLSFPELTPRMFSFNSPLGACPTCDGLGFRFTFDPGKVVPDPNLALADGALAPWKGGRNAYWRQILDSLSEHFSFSIHVPFCKLPEKIQKMMLHGSGREPIRFELKSSNNKSSYTFTKPFEGVLTQLERRYAETDSAKVREELQKYMAEMICPACEGTRLRKEARSVLVSGTPIHELVHQDVATVIKTIAGWKIKGNKLKIAERVLKEIRERLLFLNDVGLDYVTLDRSAATLSGGEAQRIRLATQIGSQLVGVLYILDEPSIGLHPSDHEKLLETLKRLRDLGNSVIVVEHDEVTMHQADWLIDMGPGAGRHGGEVIVAGTPAEVMSNERSLTGAYLSGRRHVSTVVKRRKPAAWIELQGCREHNLKDIDVRVPLGVFCAVTGVSGSGKSTLVMDTLLPWMTNRLYNTRHAVGKIDDIKNWDAIEKVIEIDQAAIGRTPRSNPATYTGVFTDIRDLFAALPEARTRGYGPGRFSFNVKGGRCEACEGDGHIKIEMHFLPDTYVPCDICKGQRYNRETLNVLYRGKSIADVLAMTVEEASEFFERIPTLRKKLETLADVGLGYVQLGQAATTLSGGEAQRVKLAKELSRSARGHTLYILDEPTTGLHFEDVRKLVGVLNRLVDEGATVIVIEHNLDVIKNSDYIIDLGHGGGAAGGVIAAIGTPEEIMQVKKSKTGQSLQAHLAHVTAKA